MNPDWVYQPGHGYVRFFFHTHSAKEVFQLLLQEASSLTQPRLLKGDAEQHDLHQKCLDLHGF